MDAQGWNTEGELPTGTPPCTAPLLLERGCQCGQPHPPLCRHRHCETQALAGDPGGTVPAVPGEAMGQASLGPEPQPPTSPTDSCPGPHCRGAGQEVRAVARTREWGASTVSFRGHASLGPPAGWTQA